MTGIIIYITYMKAIVTGAAGFLGSHLVDKLIEKGYQVVGIDNLLTGNLDNLRHLENNPQFSFLQQDVSEAFEIDFEAEEIYHLASPASPNLNSPKSYHALPFDTMLVNTMGTWNMAQMALEKEAKFLFASTSEIYGDPKESPQKETYKGNVSTTGPRAVYDEAKRFGETITSAYVRHNNLNGRIIRIFNTYGPRMALDDGRVVIEFVQAALANRPFPVFGDGSQTRSFCFVSDLIEGIVLAMEKGEAGEVYNLGNPQEFTILELAQKVKELTNAQSDIQIVASLPQDDPLQRCPDIQKAKEKLSWEPRISLEEGLQKLISALNT